MGLEYRSLSLEDQVMSDVLMASLVLETSALIKLGDDQEGLAEYMHKLLLCFFFLATICFCFSSSCHVCLLLILFVSCFQTPWPLG